MCHTVQRFRAGTIRRSFGVGGQLNRAYKRDDIHGWPRVSQGGDPNQKDCPSTATSCSGVASLERMSNRSPTR